MFSTFHIARSKHKQINVQFHLLIYVILVGIAGCKQHKTEQPSEIAVKTSDSLVYDTAPRWQNDHTLLFYTYRHDPEGAELYTINTDKTALTRLTDTYHNEWWSDTAPSGEIIYISSDFGKSERFGGSEIFSLKKDGTFTQLTKSVDTTAFNTSPRVSPDGKQLLYCSNCIGKAVNSDIILIQSDGKKPVNLTKNPAADKLACWSPDGTKILFQSNRTGSYNLYLMDLKSEALTQLTDNSFNDIQADWSSDDTIVFASDRDGDFELFTMAPDGTNQTQITFNEVRDVLPSWSPNGTKIAFSSYRFGEKDKGDIFLINRDGSYEILLTD